MNGICVELRSYADQVNLHRHDYHQIVLPCRGALDLEVEHRNGQVSQGVGVFIAAGETHAFSARGKNRFIVADLPVEDAFVPTGMADTFVGTPFFTIGADTQGLIDFLEARLAREDLTTEAISAWNGLFISSLSHRRDGRIHTALSFMRAHSSRSIGIAEIASACGVSPSRLHALFKQTLGESPHAALSRLQLDQARQLLAATDLSIAEIAARTGHTDQSALTRRMRLSDGITPGQYRRSARLAVTARGSA
jgi:AraC-like DNA-binding protein